jgi:hypothetical protein
MPGTGPGGERAQRAAPAGTPAATGRPRERVGVSGGLLRLRHRASGLPRPIQPGA